MIWENFGFFFGVMFVWKKKQGERPFLKGDLKFYMQAFELKKRGSIDAYAKLCHFLRKQVKLQNEVKDNNNLNA